MNLYIYEIEGIRLAVVAGTEDESAIVAGHYLGTRLSLSNLKEVTDIEIHVIPDISGIAIGASVASEGKPMYIH